MVLTRFFQKRTTHPTSCHYQIEGRSEFLIGGEGWTDGDLDIREVDAAKTLATAFLLFEEVWIPKDLTEVAVKTLGAALAASLIDCGRLRLWALEQEVWFLLEHLRGRGKPDAFVHAVPTPAEAQARWAKRIADACEAPHIWDALVRGTRAIDAEGSTRVVSATLSDLARPEIRSLLGLPPRVADGTEAGWDAYIVNRVARVNTAHLVGNEFRADVVEHELGLSRLAAHKWYHDVAFHRLFHSVDAFTRFLDDFSLPEFGAVVETVGVDACIRLALSERAQEFRDWFWENAVTDPSSAGAAGARFLRIAQMPSLDPRMFAVPTALKIKMLDSTGKLCQPGRPGSSQPGLSYRGEKAEQVLARQVQNYKRSRRRRIAEISGGEPERYSSCPCNSGEKYKFCHGAE